MQTVYEQFPLRKKLTCLNHVIETLLRRFRWRNSFELWIESFRICNKSELIETVDNVEHRRLSSLVQICRLEQSGGRYAEILTTGVKVFNVAHRYETARSLRFERLRGLSGGRIQLVD